MLEKVTVIIIHSNLFMCYWGETLCDACYISNKIDSKKYKKSLYELLNNKKPNINYFKVLD